jgi:hypothetical protein
MSGGPGPAQGTTAGLLAGGSARAPAPHAATAIAIDAARILTTSHCHPARSGAI